MRDAKIKRFCNVHKKQVLKQDIESCKEGELPISTWDDMDEETDGRQFIRYTPIRMGEWQCGWREILNNDNSF